ncbi:MAG: Fe-S cluster assembly scaffold protein NifU [Fusobacteriaceae bacterium]|jgi:nitrogen fixation NifU-like protein|nr:Fe-S cluster assembly scaffold protein NifU [Fusobacteriaceae bacterium]
MQYSEKVMEHFMNPRNVGVIENPDGYGKVGNPACGDIMEIFLKVDNDVITDAKFRTFGCASAIASSSISTELVKGKSIRDALQLTNKKVVEELGGLPAVKMHCSVLAEEAIKLAIENYLSKKQPQS